MRTLELPGGYIWIFFSSKDNHRFNCLLMFDTAGAVSFESVAVWLRFDKVSSLWTPFSSFFWNNWTGNTGSKCAKCDMFCYGRWRLLLVSLTSIIKFKLIRNHSIVRIVKNTDLCIKRKYKNQLNRIQYEHLTVNQQNR